MPKAEKEGESSIDGVCRLRCLCSACLISWIIQCRSCHVPRSLMLLRSGQGCCLTLSGPEYDGCYGVERRESASGELTMGSYQACPNRPDANLCLLSARFTDWVKASDLDYRHWCSSCSQIGVTGESLAGVDTLLGQRWRYIAGRKRSVEVSGPISCYSCGFVLFVSKQLVLSTRLIA